MTETKQNETNTTHLPEASIYDMTHKNTEDIFDLIKNFESQLNQNLLPNDETLEDIFQFLSNVTDICEPANNSTEDIKFVENRGQHNAIFISGNWYDPRKSKVLLSLRKQILDKNENSNPPITDWRRIRQADLSRASKTGRRASCTCGSITKIWQ